MIKDNKKYKKINKYNNIKILFNNLKNIYKKKN